MGLCAADDRVWRATMAFAFSPANPGWASGAQGGLGSVHTPRRLALGDVQEYYPTSLARLAAEQRAGRLRIAPRSVTATSELLTSEDRAAITAAFGVPVVDQFASTEGLVGHSEPGGSVLTFASDQRIAELVDADDRPLGYGIPSASVLVTNLYNLTQPLIRYRLTDRFVRQPDAVDHGHLRAIVDGRADQVFRYGDVDVHPLAVRTVMVKAAAVSEYEVRQTERGIDVAVVVEGELDDAKLVASLTDGLRGAGLLDPTVRVRVVDAIRRQPQTGKTRRFIPLQDR